MYLTLVILVLRKTIQGNYHRYQNKKKKNQELSAEERECNKSHSRKKDSDRAHHLQNEKVQDSCRYIQKQIEKVQQDIRYSIRPCKLQNNE